MPLYEAWRTEIHERWLAGTLTVALVQHLDIYDPSWRGTLTEAAPRVRAVTGAPRDAVYGDGRRGQVLAAVKALESIVADVDQNGMGGSGHDLTYLVATAEALYASLVYGFDLVDEEAAS
ncbi:hypothetical protein GCM10025867_50790 (plasmid) [Frondihabitans sucicola]|uniref:Uncharacterized protein n=1 Tax=Frondihabitans sucicola TaxID=1268041 RepID=A0ABN6YBZ1_9MICO|nr:hypothetical protein [Frondihabitans sucicola]BDZ52838.1 hypothetical protein GCM10025867_50790 [Frondihabitans sucicola]